MTSSKSHSEENDASRSKPDALRAWRREKVWELRACGLTIDEIVDTLKSKPEVRISHGTVSNDLKAKQAEVEANFKNYIEKELPIQHALALMGLEKVIKEAWRIYARSSDPKVQLTALSTISSAVMQKQAVLGDPALIEKVIKTVASLKSKISQQHEDADNDGSAAEGSESAALATEEADSS